MYTEKTENDCGIYLIYNKEKYPIERWEVRRLTEELQAHIARWDGAQEPSAASDGSSVEDSDYWADNEMIGYNGEYDF